MATYSKSEIDAIRERVKITEIVGRFVQWDKKKSMPAKGDMWACCPFHGEKSPSFHADDKRGRYHCFSCDADGDVFRFLMEQTGCSFPDAIDQLGGRADIKDEDPKVRRQREQEYKEKVAAAQKSREADEENTRDHALSLWNEAVPLAGTLGEAYFASRAVPFAIQFETLRFHPRLKYPGHGKLPAVLAMVQDPMGEFLAIWRIYLGPDGGKNKEVDNAKLGLGSYTQAGGGVRFGEPFGDVNVCEGIETGLGIHGITSGKPVLCGLSTSGMMNLIPPPDAGRFLIWPDGDVDRIRNVNGKETHIESPGIRAAKELRERQSAVGFSCAIQPTPRVGRDYLDVWQRLAKAMQKQRSGS